MAEVNPDLDGATPEEESSEETGQVAEPTLGDVLKRMDRMERIWDEKFDRVFNGMQSTTQREVGRVASQLVALEGQMGEMLTKTEITQRVLEQGLEKEDVDKVTQAVTQARKVQELEAREKARQAVPAPTFDHVRYWAAADQRLVEYANSEGMLSSDDLEDMIDLSTGQPLEGHEEEIAWFRSLITSTNEPPSHEVLDRIERQTRRKIKDAAEKKGQAKKSTTASPPTNRPLATATVTSLEAYKKSLREGSDYSPEDVDKMTAQWLRANS